MRWKVPELATNLGTNSHPRKIRDGQALEKSGGQDEIEPPTTGFSILELSSCKYAEVFDTE